MLQLTTISSSALRGTRKVWFELGSNDRPCFIFLDAELYIERVNAPEIVRGLCEAKNLPCPTCVYLSYGEAIDRHIDFACNEEFANFLASEFTPWIDNLTYRTNEFVLCGLSLSGLAAAFAALLHPCLFSRILCQSPSAWWNDEWLAGQMASQLLDPITCWLSVGDMEIDENAVHDPTQMVQKSSQVDSCRRLALAMTNAGANVSLNLYPGGHDPKCWAAELPLALNWLSLGK